MRGVVMQATEDLTLEKDVKIPQGRYFMVADIETTSVVWIHIDQCEEMQAWFCTVKLMNSQKIVQRVMHSDTEKEEAQGDTEEIFRWWLDYQGIRPLGAYFTDKESDDLPF